MRKYPRKKTRRRERGWYCTIFSARVQNVDWIGTLSEVMPGEKTRYTFKDGVLVKSEGEIGKIFWKALKARGDPNMCKFAELAIGMNPYTRKGLTSLRAPNLVMTVPPFHEIKQSEGTIHTALGDSGGRILEEGETSIVAKLHIDVVSFTPTLYIDGKSM